MQGGGVEAANRRAAGELGRVLCILSWRVFWITMMNRTAPDAPPEVAFRALELWLLDELVDDRAGKALQRNLTTYLIKLARLGGYLARAHDPPPGSKVMWRGLSRLTDIELGATIGTQLVGN